MTLATTMTARMAPQPRPQALSAWPASVGLALIIAGQPLGWTIRGQTGGGDSIVFPVGIVLVGFMLLLHPRMLVRLRLHVAPVLFAAALLVLLVPVTVLLFIDIAGLGQMLVYAIFVIGVVAAVGVNDTERFERLPEALVIIAGVSSLAPILELVIGGVGRGFFRLSISGNDNTLIVASTGAIAMLAAIVSVFSPRRGSMFWGVFCGIVWLAGLAAVLLSSTRSVFGMLLVLIPGFFLILRRRQGHGSAANGKPSGFWLVLVGGFIAAPTAAIAVLGVKTITEISGRSLMRIVGALALLNGSAGRVDESTAIRGTYAAESWARMSVWGRGVMALPYEHGNLLTYQHNAYLQAFYDLGLFGGCLYVGATVLVPLALISALVVRGKLTPTAQFAIMLFVFVQGDMLAHCTPYNWPPLLAVGLIYVLVARGPLAIAPRLGRTVPPLDGGPPLATRGALA